MSLLALFIAAVVLAVTPGPGIACVVARSARTRSLTRVPGVTMLGLGAHIALARRDA